jgi:pyruvate/2-oxoglutarate dehydrogenase complex dihydrolipoamide dehydrogenase (E3) component
MADLIETDLCVIGGGSAGLTVAAGAAQMGARTVLVERGRMGGDCLNFGCVPSKSLLAAAKLVRRARGAARFGVRLAPPEIDFQAVHDHVHDVIARIAPQDSVERFEGLGVTVLRDTARFVNPREVAAGPHRIRAKRFVVATGSRPLVPPIPGLEAVPYLTNETVFDLTRLPAHLIVIGGGPIGCELGQAFRELGARVTLIDMATILPRDDPELVDVLRTRLRADGIELIETAKVVGVARRAEGEIAVTLERDAGRQDVVGSTLLLAAGRRPCLDGLGLEEAGVAFDRGGIAVDRRLRSSNRRVYAAGDVAGGYQFTHVAGHHGGVVLRNALFRLPAKTETRAVPWVTYCDPELAQVGLSEASARAAHGAIRVLRWPFSENDRAQTERAPDGLVKVVTTARGRVLGASILGAQAGELILPWTLAVAGKLGLKDLAQAIVPYPTRGEAGKRAAGTFYTEALFGRRTKRLVRLLLRLP